jgi:hypothetical protein
VSRQKDKEGQTSEDKAATTRNPCIPDEGRQGVDPLHHVQKKHGGHLLILLVDPNQSRGAVPHRQFQKQDEVGEPSSTQNEAHVAPCRFQMKPTRRGGSDPPQFQTKSTTRLFQTKPTRREGLTLLVSSKRRPQDEMWTLLVDSKRCPQDGEGEPSSSTLAVFIASAGDVSSFLL